MIKYKFKYKFLHNLIWNYLLEDNFMLSEVCPPKICTHVQYLYCDCVVTFIYELQAQSDIIIVWDAPSWRPQTSNRSYVYHKMKTEEWRLVKPLLFWLLLLLLMTRTTDTVQTWAVGWKQCRLLQEVEHIWIYSWLWRWWRFDWEDLTSAQTSSGDRTTNKFASSNPLPALMWWIHLWVCYYSNVGLRAFSVASISS